MKRIVKVINRANGREESYLGDPEAAVIAAHAQERNDFNTGTYRERYGSLLRRSKSGMTVCCGNWSAFTQGKEGQG